MGLALFISNILYSSTLNKIDVVRDRKAIKCSNVMQVVDKIGPHVIILNGPINVKTKIFEHISIMNTPKQMKINIGGVEKITY